MDRISLDTIGIYLVSHVILSALVIGILFLFKMQLTGIFTFFIIIVSVALSAEYHKRNCNIEPKTIKKITIISAMTLVGFIVQFILSKNFRVNTPNEFYLVIGPIFMWFPFASITQKKLQN